MNARSPKRRRSPSALPPGRHGLPRSVVARNQRERLLEAVATASADLSYRDMTVADVHTKAGVSRKTFYEHFKNKDDAFLAAYDEMSARLIDQVEAAFAKSEAFEDGVVRCLGAFLDFVASEPEFAHICIVDILMAGPEALERRNRSMRAFADLVERGAALGAPSLRPP